jgi:GAF domain-containing protein
MANLTDLHREVPDVISIAQQAIERTHARSAAIFVMAAGSSALELAAAAGIEGEPLERLVAAVRDPAHPIARTVIDAKASFDVSPIAPGGPALRSHLPLLIDREGVPLVVGVLAVAHERPLDASERNTLTELAAQAAGQS